jgi:hypothetical protein
MIDLVLVALTAAAPCPQLPLTPGTSWTYRAEVAWSAVGADSVQRTTIDWTTTILTVETRDSTSVATVRDWPTGLAWWEPDQPPVTSLLVCIAERIYHVEPLEGVTQALVDSLLTGLRRPTADELILRFPLRTDDLFGRDAADRDDTLYAWYVESSQPIPAELAGLRAGLSDSLYTLAYRSLPDHQLVDFVPGLGVTRYVYGHHGTVAEASAVLVGYYAGRAAE